MSFISLPTSVGVSFISISILDMPRGTKRFSNFPKLSHQWSDRSGRLELVCTLFFCTFGSICLLQLTCYKPDVHTQKSTRGGRLLLGHISSQSRSHTCLLINILDSLEKEAQKANGLFQSRESSQLKALVLFHFFLRV